MNTSASKRKETRASAKKYQKRQNSSNLGSISAQASFLYRPSQDVFIALVVRNYVPHEVATDQNSELASINQPRICGSWVEVLPNIRSDRGTPNLVLTAAVEALGTSIMAQKLHPNRDNIESFQSYQLALRSLRKSVAVNGRFGTELLASIMCLSLVEVSL